MANPDPIKGVYRDSIVEYSGRFEEGVRSAMLCIDLQYLDAARDQGIFQGLPEEDQEYYFEKLEHEVVPNVCRLQRSFRNRGMEIIHIRIQSLTQDGRDRSPAHKRLGLLAPPGSRQARFLDPVAPRWDEIVISKTASGVFDSTNLHYVLRNLGIHQLLVTGVYTDECVSTAVRVGADLGFYVTLVEDACTTVTPELHHSSVATLRDRYARVIDTDTAIAEIREVPKATDPATNDATTGSPPGPRHLGTRRSVVLLGGHAFSKPDEALTMDRQFEFARDAIKRLAPLFENRRELVIGHGNGPQVGHMLTRVEQSLGKAYGVPLEVCVAETDGEIGYVLQQCLANAFRAQGIERSALSIITQTVVDGDDPAFEHPVKPIGPVYAEERARELEQKGFAVCEVDGGWRRVVPSPVPHEIIEAEALQELLRLGVVVIAAGGGGVPVVRDAEGNLRGIDAVVDKDAAGALLARRLNADELIILTSVPCVYKDFGTDRQEPIGRITPEAMADLAEAQSFEAGTIAPKVEAAIRFADSGGTAIICDIDSLADALRGRSGTIVSQSS